MAKRESIVPGLGKKQAAVLQNREARQLEHKRHVEELGFPQEQDKSGRPEVEAASLRYAPVSYDDPENPTPSRVVNQAGQDLADSNETPNKMVLKESLLDVSSIVKEAMDEVFIQKDKGAIGFNTPANTKPSGLKSIFGKAGKLLPWVAPLIFNPVAAKAIGITGAVVAVPYAAWKGWNALENVFESDADRAATIERITKVPPTLRTNSQQGDLKEALDEIWGKRFGMDSTGGEYIDGTTKFADPADMGTYFDILYGGESNIPAVQIDEFLENYAAPDNVARRQELGIVGQAFDGLTEFYSNAMGSLFGTADVGESLTPAEFDKRIEEMSNSDIALQDTNSTVKNILSGAVDIGKLPSGSEIVGAVKDKIGTVTNALKESIPGIGLDIEIGSKLNTEDLVQDVDVPMLDTIPQSVIAGATGLNAKQQETAAKVAIEEPKKIRDIQSQIGSAMAGTGQTPTAQQEARTKFQDPTLQIAADKRAKEMEKPTITAPPAGSSNVQADLQSTAAMAPPTAKPSGTAALGSTSKGRTLSIDEGKIDGKQYGTISGPGTADYRIQVNPKTYPKAKPGQVLQLSKMDVYQAWIEKAEGEGAMAKVQLDRVSDLAAMMHDILEDGDELPGWIQNKISDSLHNLEASISHIMYDEKEEQGLVKSKQVFHDFLAKAPQTRGNLLENEVFLQKFLGIGLLAKVAPKVAKFLTGGLLFGGAAKKGSKIVGEQIKEETKKKGVNKTLLGLGALSAAGVAGVIGYQPPSTEKDEAMQEYNSLSETMKRGIDNELKPKAQQALDMLPDPIKEVGSMAFDKITEVVDNVKRGGEFKGLTADQVSQIGAADRDAYESSWRSVDPSIRGTDKDPSFKAASYIMPLYDTSPEANARVRAGGAETIVGYSTPAGNVTLDRPVTRQQFGSGQQFTKLSKAPFGPTGGEGFLSALRGAGTAAGSQAPGTVGREFTTARDIDTGETKITGIKTDTGVQGTRDSGDLLAEIDPLGTQGSDFGGTMDIAGYKAPDTSQPETRTPEEILEDQRKDFTAGPGNTNILGQTYDDYQESIKNAIVKEAVSEFLSKAKKKGGRKKDPRLERAGVEGYNKPKRTPKHPKKSHIVVAKEGNKIKTIRYGEQGAKTAGDPKKGESAKMKKKRKSFKARHRKNIKRGKMSAAYWADKSKW